MKKLTNVSALEMVLSLQEVQANVELVEKLTVMKNQFDKKNHSTSSKLSKNQLANEGLKSEILVALQGKEPMQIKEILLLPEFAETEYTNQKFSALLKQLLEVGKVEKVIEKRLTKFKLV